MAAYRRIISLARPITLVTPGGVIFGVTALESPPLDVKPDGSGEAPADDIGRPFVGGARGFMAWVAGGWQGPANTKFVTKGDVLVSVSVDHVVSSQLVPVESAQPA